MQFCRECGGALNLFETNDDGICWNCVRQKEKQHPPVPPQPQPAEADELSGAVFCCENDMLMLKAREGWTLWSGPADQPVAFEAIVKRARHIYRIRRKRQQAKN